MVCKQSGWIHVLLEQVFWKTGGAFWSELLYCLHDFWRQVETERRTSRVTLLLVSIGASVIFALFNVHRKNCDLKERLDRASVV